MSAPDFTTVIGLEVHVQLQTESKLFCACTTRFGQPANTQTCPVCTAMPGSLPVVNRKAIELAIKTGLALNCKIAEVTKWDRKNYFYPDLPKGYQISQLDQPICGPGHLLVPDNDAEPVSIRICRAHLEEDAGKSMHDESGNGQSKIDLNRAGTPLLEIVTEPDLRSAAQAKAFLTELKLILEYLEVSDCNMQQGSLRVDANVNLHVHQDGETIATPIVEIKNMNSFRAVERALNFETQRQLKHWQETGQRLGDVPKATRGWDDKTQTTTLQREKEESSDYRYFPDPDLAPVTIEPTLVDKLRSELPELPAETRTHLVNEYGLSSYDATVIAGQGRGVVHYFVKVAQSTQNGKQAANWVTQEVLRYLNENNIEIEQYPVCDERMAVLIGKVINRELDQSRAKSVLEHLLANDHSVEQAMSELGIRTLDSNEIQSLCEEIINKHQPVVEQIRNGNAKAIGALIGAAKKAEPNIDAGQIREMLLKQIG